MEPTFSLSMVYVNVNVRFMVKMVNNDLCDRNIGKLFVIPSLNSANR
jgi:hypothetical protein